MLKHRPLQLPLAVTANEQTVDVPLDLDSEMIGSISDRTFTGVAEPGSSIEGERCKKESSFLHSWVLYRFIEMAL